MSHDRLFRILYYILEKGRATAPELEEILTALQSMLVTGRAPEHPINQRNGI